MNYLRIFYCLILIFSAAQHYADEPTLQTALISPTVVSITISLPAVQHHVIYRDYIDIAVDHPEITLSPWKTQEQSTSIYDKTLKKDMQVFSGAVTILLQAQAASPGVKNAHLHVSYLTSDHRHIIHKVFPLIFEQTMSSPQISEEKEPDALPRATRSSHVGTSAPFAPLSAALNSVTPPTLLKKLVRTLNNVAANSLLLWWCITVLLIGIGLFFLYRMPSRPSIIQRMIALCIILSAVYMVTQGIKIQRTAQDTPHLLWLNNYNQAKKLALVRTTKLLICVDSKEKSTTSWLEKLLNNDSHLHALVTACVTLKIDDTQPDASWHNFCTKYHLNPASDIWLIDPLSETVLMQSTNDILPENLTTDLEKYLTQF